MILLSAEGTPASEIYALLHCGPCTVRRWITRHAAENLAGLPDRPHSSRLRLGSLRIDDRIRAALSTPKAWTISHV